jgi:hypothetical protein
MLLGRQVVPREGSFLLYKILLEAGHHLTSQLEPRLNSGGSMSSLPASLCVSALIASPKELSTQVRAKQKESEAVCGSLGFSGP